ncbi:MAG: hypothetical protein HY914_12405 [Desulfomonile tiedjei]|nr:hypothetical protein [Desulfomonile tiedjei]
MYWWNTSKLAEDLRAGRVDERERLKYLLATLVALSIGALLLFCSGGSLGLESLIYAAVYLTIAIIGTIICYRVNRNGDNTDFIGRMICLGWPVAVSFVVMLSAVLLAFACLESIPSASLGPASFLSAMADKLRKPGNQLLESPVSPICLVVGYYWMLHRMITDVSHGEQAEGTRQTKERDWSPPKVALAVVGGMGVPITVILGYLLADSLGVQGRFRALLAFSVMGLWMLVFATILVWMDRSSWKRP